jgi:streptogramin lyase
MGSRGMTARLLWMPLLLAYAAIACCALWTASAAAEPMRLPSGDLAEFPFESEHQANALALGSDGSLWFSLEDTGQLDRMTSEGVLDTEVVLPVGEGKDVALGNDIVDIVPGPNGDIWFLNNGRNSENRPLIGYATPSGQTHESPIVSAYFTPDSLTVGLDGSLWYTADYDIGHVTLLGEVTELPLLPDEIALEEYEQGTLPEELTPGPEGNIWFIGAAENLIGPYYIGFITPEDHIEQWVVPTQFGDPGPITFDAEGNAWFMEAHGVAHVSRSGVFTEFATPALDGYSGRLVLGSEGDMWFTEPDDALGRISSSGEVTSFGPVLPEGETPALLAADADGHLWFSQAGAPLGNVSHIGRLTIPLEPSNEEPPSISGAPTVGQTLMATNGAWLHEPSTFEYQWQVCDVSGSGCVNIVGQTAATHVLTTAEVGDTLRVLVTARNVGGAVSVTTNVSSVVTVPSASQSLAPSPAFSPSAVAVGDPASPPPELPSSAKLEFERHARFVLVETVTVTNAPRLGWVDILCHGRGCPFSRRRITVAAACREHDCSPSAHGDAATVGLVSLKWPFGRKRLSVGSIVTVDIGEASWIGKSVGLVVRYHHIPALPSSCLEPDSDVATNEC